MNKWVPEQPSPWRKSCKRESCHGDRVYPYFLAMSALDVLEEAWRSQEDLGCFAIFAAALGGLEVGCEVVDEPLAHGLQVTMRMFLGKLRL